MRARKCITRDFFPAFDAFEKEGVPGTLGDSQIGADRSQQIRGKDIVDGDKVALFREALKFSEVRLDHGSEFTVDSFHSQRKETYYYITSGRLGLFVRGRWYFGSNSTYRRTMVNFVVLSKSIRITTSRKNMGPGTNVSG